MLHPPPFSLSLFSHLNSLYLLSAPQISDLRREVVGARPEDVFAVTDRRWRIWSLWWTRYRELVRLLVTTAMRAHCRLCGTRCRRLRWSEARSARFLFSCCGFVFLICLVAQKRKESIESANRVSLGQWLSSVVLSLIFEIGKNKAVDSFTCVYLGNRT